MEDERFTVRVERQDDFRFAVDFGADLPHLLLDEPPPLGAGSGPNAARLLAAAIGNCLAASLLFCLRRSRVEVDALAVVVEGSIVRTPAGRLRIGAMRVRIEPTVRPGSEEKLERCMGLFEDFCTVTGSVRDGIEVDVEVVPALAHHQP